MEVEFQTFDGVTLRGDLYLPEEQNAPLVILTPGVRGQQILLLSFLPVSYVVRTNTPHL